MTNHYLTLGLPDGAAIEAVHMAYRKALHRFHLHKQEGRPLPEADFDALQAAFNLLKHPENKAAYDRELLGDRMPEPAPSMADAAPASPELAAAPPAPPQASPASAAEIRDPVQHNFEFTGSGGEYFRIWIVNLLLSILTLGIYSAWAKVRREQYFHRNTLLDGSGFDYHGDPKAILKGRAIAWSLVLLLAMVENLAPLFHPILLLMLMPVLPWLMLRSFIFRARNTSYRGLRFDFHGSYWESFRVFIGYGLLTLVTFGLALPAFIRRIKLFQLNNLSFGGERFVSEPALGAFYGIFLRGALMAFLPLLVVGIVIATMMSDASGSQAGAMVMMALMGGIFAMIALTYLVLLAVVQPYIQARMANLVWNHTRIGEHLFASTQEFKGLLVIFVTNWALTLLTLGLYWPWAKVRLAAYRARNTALATQGSLDDFMGQANRQRQAVGEEIADAFDLDIAI